MYTTTSLDAPFTIPHAAQSGTLIGTIVRNPKKVAFLLLMIGCVMVIVALRDILSPDSTLVDLMPNFMRSILRIVRSFITLGLIIIDYKMVPLRATSDRERVAEMKRAHKKSAERLLNLCLANGGIFTKAGQHIASLNQILPPEYTTTMQPCQDKAPTRPWSEIEPLFYQEFGHGISHFFCEFDTEAIAAASLAQVYKARLHTGEQVAVKVQYPGLEQQVRSDTKIFRTLINVAEYFFQDLKLHWLLDEFEINMPHELNFEEEGHNCERLNESMSQNFKNRVKCPRIYWNVTTRKILTMEFVEGVRVNDRIGLNQLSANASQVAKLLAEVFCEQTFINGFVHCDPHPGNIRVRRDAVTNELQLVILDHGLYTQVDEALRKDYAYLWKAMIEKDDATLRRIGRHLGISNFKLFILMVTSKNYDQHDIGMSREMSPEEVRQLQQYGQDNFFLMTQILCGIDRRILLLLKNNELLRAVQMDLGIPVNYFLTFAEYAMRGINKARLAKNPSVWNHLLCTRDYMALKTKLFVATRASWLIPVWHNLTKSTRSDLQNTPWYLSNFALLLVFSLWRPLAF